MDDKSIVEHFVHDAVSPDPHSVDASLPGHSHASWRTRVSGEEVDGGTNSLLLLSRQRGESLDGTAGNLDAVWAHTRPRSALTSSQGT
jgi:hypothetical protein